jgi:hypothetical protein
MGKGQRLINFYFFFSFFGAGASALHMVPDSLQDGHFFGLQRVSTFSPHFSQVKTPMNTPPVRISHRLPRQSGKMANASPPVMIPVAPY